MKPLFTADEIDVYLTDVLIITAILSGITISALFLFFSNWGAGLGTALLTYVVFLLYRAMP